VAAAAGLDFEMDRPPSNTFVMLRLVHFGSSIRGQRSLLLNPRNGTRLASMTIGNYSLGAVIDSIPGLDPTELFGQPADDSS
jgi:hypothetical protein